MLDVNLNVVPLGHSLNEVPLAHSFLQHFLIPPLLQRPFALGTNLQMTVPVVLRDVSDLRCHPKHTAKDELQDRRTSYGPLRAPWAKNEHDDVSLALRDTTVFQHKLLQEVCEPWMVDEGFQNIDMPAKMSTSVVLRHRHI